MHLCDLSLVAQIQVEESKCSYDTDTLGGSRALTSASEMLNCTCPMHGGYQFNRAHPEMGRHIVISVVRRAGHSCYA